MIVNGPKINNKTSTLVFWDFYQRARQTRERIDRIFLGSILQIDVELDSVEIVMMEHQGSMTNRKVGVDGNSTFRDFYIRIVCIELRYEKGRIFFLSRKIKSYLSVVAENLKSKRCMFASVPKLPPWSTMRNTMVQCRKHFSGDKSSLLIRTVNSDLIGDVWTFRIHRLNINRKHHKIQENRTCHFLEKCLVLSPSFLILLLYA